MLQTDCPLGSRSLLYTLLHQSHIKCIKGLLRSATNTAPAMDERVCGWLAASTKKASPQCKTCACVYSEGCAQSTGERNEHCLSKWNQTGLFNQFIIFGLFTNLLVLIFMFFVLYRERSIWRSIWAVWNNDHWECWCQHFNVGGCGECQRQHCTS